MEQDTHKMDPARSVIALFAEELPDGRRRSGESVIARSLAISYSSVYRWQIPKTVDPRGLDGRVPGKHYGNLRWLAAKKGKDLPWSLLTGEKAHG